MEQKFAHATGTGGWHLINVNHLSPRHENYKKCYFLAKSAHITSLFRKKFLILSSNSCLR